MPYVQNDIWSILDTTDYRPHGIPKWMGTRTTMEINAKHLWIDFDVTAARGAVTNDANLGGDA